MPTSRRSLFTLLKITIISFLIAIPHRARNICSQISDRVLTRIPLLKFLFLGHVNHTGSIAVRYRETITLTITL